MEVVECASGACGAPIIKARHVVSGKTMPMDAEPVDPDIVRKGLFELQEPEEFETDRRPIASSIKPDDAAMNGIEVYVSHFSTCDDVERFRR